MPIIGITDTEMIELPWVAKIRKGEPKAPNRPGRDLNQQFRLQFAPGKRADDDRELFQTQFEGFVPYPVQVGRNGQRLDLLGMKLTFFFPFAEIERQWDANIVAHRKGGLMARGNGKTWEYLRDADGTLLVRNGVVVEPHQDIFGNSYERGDQRTFHENEPLYKDRRGPVFGSVNARLNIMIPGYDIRFFQVMTTSWNDVYRISGMLRGIKNLCEQIGTNMAGVPLDLYRYPVEISKRNQEGTRFREISWLWTISPSAQWVARELTALSPETYSYLLPEGQKVRRELEGVVEGELIEDARKDSRQDLDTLNFLADEQATDEENGSVELDIEGEFEIPSWVDLPGNILVNDARSLYWAVAFNQIGIKPDDANKIVNDCNGNWVKALETIRPQ